MANKIENKTALTIFIAVAIIAGIFLVYLLEKQPSVPKTVADQVAAVVTSGNLNECSAFTNASTSDGISYATICRNNVALALANKNLDPSYCADLDGTLASSTQCEATVLTEKAIQASDVSLCTQASTAAIATACEDAYQANQALQAGSPAACASLSSSSTVAACQNNMLIQQLEKDPKTFACSQFSSPGLVTNCEAFQKVVVQGDPTGCLEITDVRLRSVCANP